MLWNCHVFFFFLQPSKCRKSSHNKENEILPQKTKTKAVGEKDNDPSPSDTTDNHQIITNSQQEEPLQSSTLLENDQPSNTQKDGIVDSKSQRSKQPNLELDLQDCSHKKDIVNTFKTSSYAVPLSPVSEVLKGVETGGSAISPTGGEGEIEKDTPAPVAPPRRKRKKKPEQSKELSDKAVDESRVIH